MRARALVTSLAIVLVVAACSVVGDGKVDTIDPPFGLADTAAPSTTAAPTTTVLASTTTIGLETTTTLVQTEPVRLYFITSGQLLYVEGALPAPAALQQIVAALQLGTEPLGDLGAGLRSAVPSAAEIRVLDTGAGIANVELPVGFFDGIPALDQRLAIGQIVLTLTDSRGVGQVQFDLAVPDATGQVIQPGTPLSRLDYVPLLLDAPRV
ncbi:MAG: Sporulation and spore germination [Actinomycetota bacterium]|jgi:hypothetical protein